MYRVLVGIPTYKRPEMLRECLASATTQRAAAEIIIVVADNDAAVRHGAAVADELGIPSIVVPERGISHVRNAILLHGYENGADFIAMIDDDETASPNWIANLLAVQQSTGADVVGGPVNYVHDPIPAIVNSKAFWHPARPSGPTTYLYAGNNLLVATRSLYKASWPRFDPAFGLSGGEDSEWLSRLRNGGFLFAWAAEAIVNEVVAPERMTTRWILRRSYCIGNSYVRIRLKHRDWTRLGMVMAHSALVALAAVPMLPVLLLPDWRLWLLRKWAKVAGRLSALAGLEVRPYA